MGKTTAKTEPVSMAADQQNFAREVLEAEIKAIHVVSEHLDASFDRAVAMLDACEGNVIVSGVGKAGLIGQKISATLASTGTPSHFLHPAEAMHGDLGRIRRNDLLMMLSYSGESDEILSLAAVVRQDNVPVISITAHKTSHLGKISDLVLPLGDIAEACPLNLAPTASTTAMLALGDALAMTVSRCRAFSADDFHKRHPGGQLGRQMMPITELLRFKVGDNLPLVRDNLTVAEVLGESQVSGRRAGAVMLIDEQGRLSGIFTDGDLRRLMQSRGGEALELPIREVMTTSPRHLRDDATVRDAVQVVREMRLDEIPVVDAELHPIGLVDVQDLIAMKIIEE